MKTSKSPAPPAAQSSNQRESRARSRREVAHTGDYDAALAGGVSFAAEFSVKALGDPRLHDRAVAVAESAYRHPECTLPTMVGGAAEAAGLYRFLGYQHVTVDKLSSGHFAQTAKRAQQAAGPVLVLHDTTTFGFGMTTARRGLGPIAGGGRGFMAHVSLAVQEGSRLPLGLLACSTMVRPLEATPPIDVQAGLADGAAVGSTPLALPAPEQPIVAPNGTAKKDGKAERDSRRRSKKSKRKKDKRQDDANNESHRWAKQALATGKALRLLGVDVIHVMDREADSYLIVATLVVPNTGEHAVIRVKDNRALKDGTKLFTQLAGLECKATRTVRINARAPAASAKQRKTNPPREEREAVLHFSGGTVEIPRTSHAPRSLPASVKLNYVHVWEPDPPPGCEAVEWYLMTTLPIDTAEQLLRVVDIYRARWAIEDWNKAVKTGCSFGDHQLESYNALCKLLALLLPVAWKLLLLRHMADAEPNAPAELVLTRQQITILRAVHDKQHPRSRLPQRPTVTDVTWAIGRLGGHFRNNGAPGWITLGRGMRRLLEIEEGIEAVFALRKPDSG
jgi:hypothetical protein